MNICLYLIVNIPTIMYRAFEKAVQSLKLAHLFKENPYSSDSTSSTWVHSSNENEQKVTALRVHTGPHQQKQGISVMTPTSRARQALSMLGCIDYNTTRFAQVVAHNDLRKFMYSGRASWAYNRWIDMPLVDPFLVKALTIKYRLHPLAVENLLDTAQVSPFFCCISEAHLCLFMRPLPQMVIQLFVSNEVFRYA
jgi:hypothetical protein